MRTTTEQEQRPGLALEIAEPYTGEAVKLPGDPAKAGAISEPDSPEAFYLLNATKGAA